MAEQINLNKTVYSKTQFERVIDTSFTQLVETPTVTPAAIPSVTTAEFFQNYQEIFYQIPKFGDINSHEYLIKTSQAYLGSNDKNIGNFNSFSNSAQLSINNLNATSTTILEVRNYQLII